MTKMIAEIKVSRRGTIVVSKEVAEALNIEEGSRLRLEVKGDSIVLRVVPDATRLSIHGEKFARMTLEELEEKSIEEQERYVE